MEKFEVLINLTAHVSSSAADELEYLVEEFVQGVENVFANDQIDRLAEQINTLIPGAVVDVSGYHDYGSMFETFGVGSDAGSDAPVESANLLPGNAVGEGFPGKRYTAAENDFGSTDFDKR